MHNRTPDGKFTFGNPEPAIERFYRKVEKMPNGCWQWTGKPTKAGYGNFSIQNRRVYAHRFAYETFIGPIPKGKELDHLCRNTLCVNPAHLEPVLHTLNVRRGDAPIVNRERHLALTHCAKGHLFNEENTFTDKHGFRHCGICMLEWSKEFETRHMGKCLKCGSPIARRSKLCQKCYQLGRRK